MLVSKDIVVVHHIQEAYFNCTHQTYEMFRFVAVDPLATHILKVGRTFRGQGALLISTTILACTTLQADDDSYVRVDLFLTQLSLLPRTWLHWGDITVYQAERDPDNTWFVTEAEWALEEYPPFAGMENILSIDLAQAIAAGRLKMHRQSAMFGSG